MTAPHSPLSTPTQEPLYSTPTTPPTYPHVPERIPPTRPEKSLRRNLYATWHDYRYTYSGLTLPLHLKHSSFPTEALERPTTYLACPTRSPCKPECYPIERDRSISIQLSRRCAWAFDLIIMLYKRTSCTVYTSQPQDSSAGSLFQACCADSLIYAVRLA